MRKSVRIHRVSRNLRDVDIHSLIDIVAPYEYVTFTLEETDKIAQLEAEVIALRISLVEQIESRDKKLEALSHVLVGD